MVVCAIDRPRSAIISTRSRRLSLNRRYQRTHKMMTSRSKWRPSNSSSTLFSLPIADPQPFSRQHSRSDRAVCTRAEPAIGARASAKVEAVASATYSRSRKHTITEVIPADVTRKKVGAWLEVLSPITEWAGLKADAIRYKRNLMRIYHDETIAAITEKARDQLAKNASLATPVPTKFLVPFLEQASLDEPDSPLVELWPNLLASAAEGYRSEHPHFISII